MRQIMILSTALALCGPSLAADEPAPTAASPIIERNQYVVMKSYPAVSLRRGEEGIVKFRIRTTRLGNIDACQVIQSSGYAALDKGTCEMLLAGATATPLTAENGWRVEGTRDGIVNWTLPEGAKRPATPPPYTSSQNAAGEPLICKRQQKIGSLTASEKVCLTAADWKRQIDHAQRETHDMQSARGPWSPTN